MKECIKGYVCIIGDYSISDNVENDNKTTSRNDRELQLYKKVHTVVTMLITNLIIRMYVHIYAYIHIRKQ